VREEGDDEEKKTHLCKQKLIAGAKSRKDCINKSVEPRRVEQSSMWGEKMNYKKETEEGGVLVDNESSWENPASSNFLNRVDEGFGKKGRKVNNFGRVQIPGCRGANYLLALKSGDRRCFVVTMGGIEGTKYRRALKLLRNPGLLLNEGSGTEWEKDREVKNNSIRRASKGFLMRGKEYY